MSWYTEGNRPLAMRSADDRGPAYTAAVERSEAAFDHVRQALGGGPATAANTAAELATMAAALPPETGITIDPVTHVPAGADPGEDWRCSTVATIASFAARPQVPVRDDRGREHDVIVPGVELTTWLLPPARRSPNPGTGATPMARYDRFLEALDGESPGEVLRAASTLLSQVATLLTGDDGPGRYLPGGHPVDAEITWQAGQLGELATDLAALAPLADAAETEDAEDGPSGG
jgi:hypothetical protein